jgi:peptide/nickel transport system permease protein
MIIQIVPGDPARVVLGVQATDENVAALRERMGLNEPVLTQYWTWLSGAVHGDFGNSLVTGQTVAPQIRRSLGPTIQLATVGLLIGMLIAFPLGITSALKRGSKVDVVASIVSQIGVAIPDFWMSILLILLFSLSLDWLPPSGYTAMSENLWDWFKHIIMPATAVGLISGSIQTRFIRSAMLEVMQENYIRTARSKGLREQVILTRHALRNAMIPIVTILGLQMTALLSSVVVVEIVFAYPGLGRLALNAVLDRDYPLLQATVLITAVMVTIINLCVDLLYYFLDPRVQSG